MTYGIVIITHNSNNILKRCLDSIFVNGVDVKVLVVNSQSNDGTLKLAKKYNVEILSIPRITFNHGLTREFARKVLNTDIVVMMTPDAYFYDNISIKNLITPLIGLTSSVAYSRQIPHLGSGHMESLPRILNYPNQKHTEIRSIEDFSRLGAYTYFCSNSCAAYLNKDLNDVGGFPCVLTNEDYYVTFSLINAGKKSAYVSNSIVYHSHDYNLIDEFRRAFDLGYSRSQNQVEAILNNSTSKTGIGYAKKAIFFTFKKSPLLLPYLIINLSVRFLGFKIGINSKFLSIKLIKRLSSQDFYWNSIYFKN